MYAVVGRLRTHLESHYKLNQLSASSNPRVKQQSPFDLLDPSQSDQWFGNGKFLKLKPGQTIVFNQSLQDRIYFVVEGEVRFLGNVDGDIITIQRAGVGQLLGWVSLLRAEPCEWVTAVDSTIVFAYRLKIFLDCTL